MAARDQGREHQARVGNVIVNTVASEPPPIAGPVPRPRRPAILPPAGAWDTHAHIFGPVDRFPFAAGRGYTPPPAPLETYLALLDHLGLARGVIVQGNAHGYDNRVVLDALERHGDRLRGVAITDTRVAPATLRDWHRLGMRGLRFHLFPPGGNPNYIRGVGLDVFEAFRPTMRELGWVMQVWCDWRIMTELAGRLHDVAAEMPVVVDHMLNIPAERGIADPAFQALLRLVGEGAVHVKLSAPYRLSGAFPDYPDARLFHDALLRANPERLLWGTDWPHPQIAGEVMPDDGHLVDLFHAWTPDARHRHLILVETPARLLT
ncbi:MAG: amidohydrolase family protein [Rhizobiales bacterium]|nr:amidohydrolase family protein [Hyphomicrobiales bacterium]